jgi:hypothetical protein
MIGPHPGTLPVIHSDFSIYAQGLKDEATLRQFWLRRDQEFLGRAVCEAYNIPATADILEFNLNLTLAAQEYNNHPIQPPGLPASYPTPEKLVTEDSIRVS